MFVDRLKTEVASFFDFYHFQIKVAQYFRLSFKFYENCNNSVSNFMT